MYYAQINTDRVVFAITQTSAPVESTEMIELPEFDQSVLGKRHNAAIGTWEAPPPPPALRRVSTLAFRRRFTKAERIAIEWAAVDRADQSLAQRQQAAALRATLADQNAAKLIDLDDADSVTGVQDLEAMGLIELGRAAQILTSPIQPEELP